MLYNVVIHVTVLTGMWYQRHAAYIAPIWSNAKFSTAYITYLIDGSFQLIYYNYVMYTMYALA